MAISINIERTVQLEGTVKLYEGSFDFDSSYPTGGESFDVSNNERFSTLIAGSKSGYVFSWDAANQKILAYRQKDPGNAGGADIALPEVANTTDLSSVTGVRFIALGS